MSLPTLFALWTAQGLLAFVWLLLLPTDSGNFSWGRWTLLGITLTLSILSALGWRLVRAKNTPLALAPVLHNALYLLALTAALAAPLTLLVLQALGQTSYTYTAYASRLAPLATWFTLAGLEWLFLHRPPNPIRIPPSSLRPFLVITFVLGLLFLLIRFTGWGLTPTRDGSFGFPSTPFLEWQVLLALVVALLAGFLLQGLSTHRLDVILFVLTYLLTCLLWLADPLVPGFFATPPRAPNFEPYPFSDALIYAQYAQQALIGEGLLWPDIPTRPFYVSLLVWQHALVGQSYYAVITLQTLWLAFFPALLYLLGKEFGSRPLGLLLALLAALRDLTANHAAPFALNYTYSKLYFSEIPTALFLVLFTILAIRWLKTPKPPAYALLMGGILGIAALIRLQSVILLGALALVSLIPLWRTRRADWLRSLVWMTLGLLLALAPWLIRNTLAAGGLVLDNPISQSMVLARRWSGSSGNESLPRLPGESTAQYVSRLNRMALEHLQRNPQRILGSAANHFFNNLITSLHTFPVRDQLTSLDELRWPRHAFWQSGFRSIPHTLLYTLLFAIGLTAAWLHLRWAGLLPLAFSLFYHAWTALFLSSGDRFLVPIDWTTYLYQAWGLLLLAQSALTGLRGVPPALSQDTCASIESPLSGGSAGWKRTAPTVALILFLGTSIPLTELVFPQRYSASAACPFATRPEEVCVQGRAIYPRYYESGDGEPGTAKRGYEISAEARLVFWLAGPQPGLVILPLETAPVFFPHAADVWISGTKDDETLRANLVQVEQNGTVIVLHRTP
ncbi:MAG: hypothetical protein N2117_04965 [Anaerolineales bacterium]|nr:hypothetical protein [Anaerolineales bacterium]MCX7754580.1 hypothetical protein [Anaerolineales bacterium]MDW8277181.1 hypothetical protein [Anaerolineales bacterium]